MPSWEDQISKMGSRRYSNLKEVKGYQTPVQNKLASVRGIMVNRTTYTIHKSQIHILLTPNFLYAICSFPPCRV